MDVPSKNHLLLYSKKVEIDSLKTRERVKTGAQHNRRWVVVCIPAPPNKSLHNPFIFPLPFFQLQILQWQYQVETG